MVCVEAADGTPLAGTLRILNPYLVSVDESGHLVIDGAGETPIRTNFDGRFIAGGRTWRLVVLRGLAPNDGRWAEGVLTRHFDTFRLGANVSAYIAGTLASGVPAGYLKVSTPNLTQDGANQLKARWMESHGRGRRSIAVLNSTVDFQPIAMSPVDADAANLVHVARGEIAHAFGLDGTWAGEGMSGMTYNNASDRRRDLVDISLGGWAQSLMAVISSLLPYGTRATVNWATFTAPSLEQLTQQLVALHTAGLITEKEARAYLGLAPWTGPDPNYAAWLAARQEVQP
jgi:phage portal protein BeeE